MNLGLAIGIAVAVAANLHYENRAVRALGLAYLLIATWALSR